MLCLADADNPERNVDLVGPGSCILREQESVNFEVRLNRTAVTVEPGVSIAHPAGGLLYALDVNGDAVIQRLQIMHPRIEQLSGLHVVGEDGLK